MKFTITKDALQEALTDVAPGVSPKTTLPVLANILLVAEGDSVRFTATDLDLGLVQSVPAKVDEPGATTVPAKKLAEIASNLPDAPVTFTLKGNRIELKCGRSEFKLLTLPPEEFPALPTVDFTNGSRVPGRTLADLIHRTAFAVSTEESRPVLGGVFWKWQDGEMTMVATNGHRLAREISAVATTGSAEMIVPPKALAQVRRLIDVAQDVEVARNDNYVAFRQGGVLVTARLIEGPYPPYERVIPQDNDRVLIGSKDELIGAFKRMAVLASEGMRKVRLSLNGKVELSVQTPDLGDAKDEVTDAEYTGEPITIAFNVSYLLEILKYLPTERVKMTFKAPERAATIEPVASADQTAPRVDYLLMPLRIAD